MRAIGVCLVLSLLMSVGCASRRDRDETAMDALWKQGYGYNNPNAERIRKGLPPVSFDSDSD